MKDSRLAESSRTSEMFGGGFLQQGQISGKTNGCVADG